ncbi:uncharacterized protein LOC142973926 [Anticarsia gemmatalis]|uniref:uncharacterized protein LOC142973926 n=1 Tax=Anticarsia gemmatalis TaxID=129554 RepID=UPI003F75A884
MNSMGDAFTTRRETPSYFWNCLTLSDNCPFTSSDDPKLFYFGMGLISLYLSFLIMIGADLSFFWSLDRFQRQIDYYINLVKTKVNYVQTDQRRLMSAEERTQKQLERSKQCRRVVNAMREALGSDERQLVSSSIDFQSQAHHFRCSPLELGTQPRRPHLSVNVCGWPH